MRTDCWLEIQKGRNYSEGLSVGVRTVLIRDLRNSCVRMWTGVTVLTDRIVKGGKFHDS